MNLFSVYNRVISQEFARMAKQRVKTTSDGATCRNDMNGPILRSFYLKREEFLDPNYKVTKAVSEKPDKSHFPSFMKE